MDLIRPHLERRRDPPRMRRFNGTADLYETVDKEIFTGRFLKKIPAACNNRESDSFIQSSMKAAILAVAISHFGHGSRVFPFPSYLNFPCRSIFKIQFLMMVSRPAALRKTRNAEASIPSPRRSESGL